MNQETIDPKTIKIIAKEIWESDESTIELEECCERLVKKHLPKLTYWQVCDVLENVQHKVRRQISREITACREKHITPRYEFSEISNVIYRVRDIRIDGIRSKIKAVDWRDFENLCKHLLEVNGIKEAEVTRGTKEGGIDFYGLLRMREYSPGILLSGLEIRITGQAKHHSGDSKVGEPEMNAFIKQFQDFKNGRGKGQKAVPKWFRRLKSPTTGIFITNTEFTQDALNAARDAGIITRDGDQIAEDLVRSPRLNEWL